MLSSLRHFRVRPASRLASMSHRAVSTDVSSKAASMEPPALPETKTILVNDGRCILEYVDVAPPTRASATVVLVHGSPGTIRDFRHLIPLLSTRTRVIAFNAPGFGASRAVQPSEAFAQIAARPAAEAVSEAVTKLCTDDENVFVAGHSYGGHMAITLAKLAHDKAPPNNVKGLVLLASAGHRAHQSISPRAKSVMVTIIKAQIPIVSRATEHLVRWIMTNFAGFQRGQPTSFFVSALVRITTTDYARVMRDLAALPPVPTFYAWSKNDFHIEEDISQTLNQAAKGPGPRIVFEKGGHNIQKTRADVLAEELLKWIDDVVQGRPITTTMQSKL